MKLNVWKMKDGSFTFWDNESPVIEYGGNESKGRTARHLGTIEVDEPGKEIKPDTSVKPPKFQVFNEGYDGGRAAVDNKELHLSSYELAPGDKPKKTVTKEANLYILNISGRDGLNDYIVKVPVNAKNIKCTYEVTE